MATQKPPFDINTRIKWKRDTSANWTTNDPVLLNGEIIIVDTANGETRFKIGDGAKKYSQLPFEDEAVRALINDKPDIKIETWNNSNAPASSTALDELIINKVASAEIYEQMKANGKTDENEIYLIEGVEEEMEIEPTLTSGTKIASFEVTQPPQTPLSKGITQHAVGP